MLMLVKNNNILDYFIYHKEEKYLLGNKNLDNKEYQKDLVGKYLDNKSIKNILFRCTYQNRLLASKLLSFLEEIRFHKEKFLASKFISDIKYHYLGS